MMVLLTAAIGEDDGTGDKQDPALCSG